MQKCSCSSSGSNPPNTSPMLLILKARWHFFGHWWYFPDFSQQIFFSHSLLPLTSSLSTLTLLSNYKSYKVEEEEEGRRPTFMEYLWVVKSSQVSLNLDSSPPPSILSKSQLTLTFFLSKLVDICQILGPRGESLVVIPFSNILL